MSLEMQCACKTPGFGLRGQEANVRLVSENKSTVQAPGQGKPSSSGRARKRNIDDFEEDDLYQPANGRKRHRVSIAQAHIPQSYQACAVHAQSRCWMQDTNFWQASPTRGVHKGR